MGLSWLIAVWMAWADPADPADPAAAAVAGVAAPDPEAGADAEAPMGAPTDPNASSAPRVPVRWTIPPEVLEAVRAVRTGTIGERVEAASRALLGRPYLYDPEGEGLGVDADPPSRYDAFDCLSFVEEMLGLALAGDPLYAPQIRDAVRYSGTPAYENRRHFMEAEWVPAAIREGLVEDITGRLGHARVLRKSVTAEVWKHWRHRSFFKFPDSRLPVGEWTLQYLDLAEATQAAPKIPPGAIVLTLRVDRPYVPVVVSHMSMVVPPAKPGGELRMRHATRMGIRDVRDDRLGWYTVHLRDYVKWPSLGITVLMPREQGPRISALTPVALPPPQSLADGPLPTFEAQPIPPFPARGPDTLQEAP